MASRFERLYSLCCDDQQAMKGLREVYMEFPLGLRKALMDWIEEQEWHEAQTDETLARNYYDEMIQLAETSGSEDKQFYINTLKKNYQENPVNLAETVMGMLDLEAQMLENIQGIQEKKHEEMEEEEQYSLDYEEKLRQIREILEDLERWQDVKMKALMHQTELQAIMEQAQRNPNGQIDPARQEQQKLQEQLQCYCEHITARWSQLQELLQVLVKSLLDDVDRFRRCQELEFVKAFPTARLERKLENLKKWCGDLGKLLWDLYDETRSVELEMELSAIPNFREHLWALLDEMIRRATIMTKQPAICVKLSSSTNGKSKDFELGICMQAARDLSTNMTTQVTDAAIIFENRCQTQQHLDNPNSIKACQLSWNKDKTKFDDSGTAKIVNVRVENFSRRPKDDKGGERVCQQRFRIVVKVKMSLSNYPLIEFQVVSLPFILITGANQSFDAYGAMLWYLFPKGDGPQECHYQPPFPCKQELSLGSIMEMLNAVITAISPRRPLRDDEMEYLSERLMNKSQVDMNTPVSIDKFLFEKIPVAKVKDQFPFWKWFTAVVNLIENYLRDPWADGVIHGFIGNAGAAQKLRNREEGTFLLRFSESVVVGDSLSVCGGLVPTVVVPPTIDKSRVSSVLALGTEYFKKASLADLPTRPIIDRNSSGDRSVELRELYDNGRDAKIALSKYTKEDVVDVNTRYEQFKLQMTIVPVIRGLDRLRLRSQSSEPRDNLSQQRPLDRQSSRQSQVCQSPSQAAVASPGGLMLGDPAPSPFSSHPFSPAGTIGSPPSAQTCPCPSPHSASSQLFPGSSPTSPAMVSVCSTAAAQQGWSTEAPLQQQQRNRAMGGGTMHILQGDGSSGSGMEPMDTTTATQQQHGSAGPAGMMSTLHSSHLPDHQTFPVMDNRELADHAGNVLEELRSGQELRPGSAVGGTGNVPDLSQLLQGENQLQLLQGENQMSEEELNVLLLKFFEANSGQ